MLTLKKLRRRVRSVKNTMQITRAMEMVSAAKLRRAELALKSFRPYAKNIEIIFSRLLKSRQEISHPLLESRGSERILLVLVTSDRGLCGAFNSDLIERAQEFIELRRGKELKLFCVGRRGYSRFSKQDIEIIGQMLDLGSRASMPTSLELSRQLQAFFLEQLVDEVHVLYASFISRAIHRPKIERLLPVKIEDLLANMGKSDRNQAEIPIHREMPAEIDYILEPGLDDVVKALVPQYVNSRLHLILTEAFTSEHSARMIAMTNATRNCRDMIGHLTLQLNKARQAAITKELLDIVGGAEALRGH